MIEITWNLLKVDLKEADRICALEIVSCEHCIKLATVRGKVINQRVANPCEEGDAQARILESKSCWFKSWCLQKLFSLKIFVKVYLFDHIAVKFVKVV